MPEHYGIDLGTRNTAVEWKAGRLTAVGAGTIPSAIAYDKLSDEIKCGEEALAILTSPDAELRDRWSVATSFKTALSSDLPFVSAGGRTLTAEQVLRDYFKLLARQASRKEFPELATAVFSIPVGFDAKSRVRLLDAARSAGIEPLGIVGESTAAYLRILHELGAAERVAIVDWGAGTLDISVLRIGSAGGLGAVIDEFSCEGSGIAGDRIDAAIYESFAAEARASGRDIPAIENVPAQLRRAVFRAIERAKIALSSRENRVDAFDVPFLAFTDGKFANFRLTGAGLKAIAAQAVSHVFEVLERSIKKAGLAVAQLDRIIFVGGCTRVLGFLEEARRRYAQAAVFPEDREWVVSSGALEVARGHAVYESVQQFGCVLDDGSFLPLSHANAFDGQSSQITVAATESTHLASLVIAERQGERDALVGTLSVPLQGHVGEPVHLRTTLAKDLTVQVRAWSHCGLDSLDSRELTITNTRCRFRVNA